MIIYIGFGPTMILPERLIIVLVRILMCNIKRPTIQGLVPIATLMQMRSNGKKETPIFL